MHQALIDPSTDSAKLWLVKITVPGYDVMRLARNTEDVKYGQFVFEKNNFDIALAAMTSDGSVPQVILKVAQDPDHVLEDIVNETQGASDGSVTIYHVNEDFLSNEINELKADYDILTGNSDYEWVYLILGLPSPLLRKIPLRIDSSKQCPYALPELYKGPECQYDGEDATCTGYYDDCRTKGNDGLWGGEMGLDPNAGRA